MRLLDALFLSSSVVERSTVNRLVAGSNPAWGVQLNPKIENCYYHFDGGVCGCQTPVSLRSGHDFVSNKLQSNSQSDGLKGINTLWDTRSTFTTILLKKKS
jgi:hypothetical protein